MNKLGLAVVAITVMLLAAPAAQADRYFVITNQYGQTAVTDGNPTNGWSVLWGPFSTVDQAERAAGTGKGPMQYFTSLQPSPQVVPRVEGGPFFAENMP
jgi:hypothetical protein